MTAESARPGFKCHLGPFLQLGAEASAFAEVQGHTVQGIRYMVG